MLSFGFDNFLVTIDTERETRNVEPNRQPFGGTAFAELRQNKLPTNRLSTATGPIVRSYRSSW